MRKSRFSDEQSVAILGEGDGDPIAAVARRHGIHALATGASASFSAVTVTI